MPNGAYARSLVPAVRPGDYVQLEPSGDVYRVRRYIALPGITRGSDITVPGNDNTQQEMTEVSMNNNELGQFRWLDIGQEISGDVTVTLDQQGQQNPLYTTKNQRADWVRATGTEVGYDEDGSSVVTDNVYSAMTEFFVYQDNPPYMTFTKSTAGSENIRPRFTGFKYLLTSSTVNTSELNITPVSLPVGKIGD